MEFRGLVLDPFQVEAIRHIEHGESVVVSAATGTGKTIIADYAIDWSSKRGKKVFYTAPIKALSNQKFREFKKLYGKEYVGILTGDVVINPEAPLLIMTTEIYRNMLLAKDPIIDDLAIVVFDEIHYLGDRERGTVWEEAVIFSPGHVRMLCLSATIPNARQFANWIESVQNHPVHVVTERKRAVPLHHVFFDNKFGLGTIEDIRSRKRQGKYPNSRGRKMRQRGQRKLSHSDLIKQLEQKGWLPCIYFCFSRASTEKKAEELARKKSLLTHEDMRKVEERITLFRNGTEQDILQLNTTKRLLHALKMGVAFHHAGLLPALKELVEVLFSENLLRALYATETFAVGVNLPAKSVCFDSLEKYDGYEFRYLHSKEYFQLAGRAGRRGIDKKGYAISYVDPEFADLGMIEKITSSDSESLQSQYKLSYNTVLNMVAGHNDQERKEILLSSFYTYQKAGKRGEQMLRVYDKKVARLIELGYLRDEDTLTYKGQFARKIYQHELILTELFTSTLIDNFSDVQILLAIGALEYEERHNVKFAKRPSPEAKGLMESFRQYQKIFRHYKKTAVYKLEPLIQSWYSGAEFSDLLDLVTMPEGDIIRFFRRLIDVLQQIRQATTDELLKERIERILRAIDRDIVEVRL